MTTTKHTRRHKKLAVIFTSLSLLGSTGLFATFTDSISTQTQNLTTGSGTIELTDGSLWHTVDSSVSDLVPGDTVTRTLTVHNGATYDFATVSLTVGDSQPGAPMTSNPEGLKMTVERCTSAYASCSSLYGPGAPTGNILSDIGGGVLTSGGNTYLKITQAFVGPNTDKSLKNKQAHMLYTFNATQRAGVGGSVASFNWSTATSSSLTAPGLFYGQASVKDSSGRLVVAGGNNANDPSGNLTSVERFDPTTDTWTAVASNLTGGVAAIAGDGAVYMADVNGLHKFTKIAPDGTVTDLSPPTITGLNSNGAIDGLGRSYFLDNDGTISRYTPTTNSWEQLNPPSVHTSHLTAANGSIYLSGGYDVLTGDYTKAFQRYNDSTGNWDMLADIPQISDAAPTQDSNYLYVFGGYDPNNNYVPLTTVSRYNLTTNSWETLAPMNIPRDLESVELLGNGKFILAGGAINENYDPTSTVELYDPTTGVSTNLANLTYAAYGAASLATDHSFYLFAGWQVLPDNSQSYGDQASKLG